jgi:hypothetical protein
MATPNVEALRAMRALLDQQIASAEIASAPPVASSVPMFLTAFDFGERVHMTADTVRELCAEGMPHVRPRRRLIRVKVAEAEAWLEKRSVGTTKAAEMGKIAARKGQE